jgi:hypothetical protein
VVIVDGELRNSVSYLTPSHSSSRRSLISQTYYSAVATKLRPLGPPYRAPWTLFP